MRIFPQQKLLLLSRKHTWIWGLCRRNLDEVSKFAFLIQSIQSIKPASVPDRFFRALADIRSTKSKIWAYFSAAIEGKTRVSSKLMSLWQKFHGAEEIALTERDFQKKGWCKGVDELSRLTQYLSWRDPYFRVTVNSPSTLLLDSNCKEIRPLLKQVSKLRVRIKRRSQNETKMICLQFSHWKHYLLHIKPLDLQ